VTAADTDIVVLDVVTRWMIDAALFLAAAAGFLIVSLAGDRAARVVVSFTIGIGVGVLLERIGSTLPSSRRLANANAPPDGVRRKSILGYALESFCWIGALYAIVAGVTWAWGDARMYAWLGGWLTAFAIVRLYGIARARRVEQLDRVTLLVGVGTWRHRTLGYYASRSPS
jgi:hypothetical protein